MADRPFRWALFGTGPVSRKFAHGLAALGSAASVAVVASQRLERSRAFAADFAGARAADSYEDALTVEVDAVHVATPPALHEAHALLAIRAGRAVLVEKPFAVDAAGAARIAEAARSAGVFCMEAMWTRFLPLTSWLRARIEAGALGTLTGFDGCFLGAARSDPARSLFDPTMGGGALMHRGIYPLSLARHFLGPVSGLCAVGRIGPTGVDEDCAIVLRHASGAVSCIRASLVADGMSGASIYGTAGTVEIAPPIWRPTSAVLRPTSQSNDAPAPRRFERVRETAAGQRIATRVIAPLRALCSPSERLRAGFAGNGYTHEASAVMEAVQAGRTEAAEMPLAESVELMGLIDRARAEIAHG